MAVLSDHKTNGSFMGIRAIVLFCAFTLLLQLPQSVDAKAARTIAWPASPSDPSTLKCFTDSTKPECLTYQQLQITFAEREKRKPKQQRKPQLLAPVLPSIALPVVVAPTSSVSTAAPSSAATEPPAVIPRSEDDVLEERQASTPIKILLVGDSLTHGHEGDWTWRYRLWQWFKANGISVQFVGPWSGTINPRVPAPPPRPYVPGDSVTADSTLYTTGGYHKPVVAAFNKLPTQHQHYSYWGRTAISVIPNINGLVATYQPDFVLASIGYNDVTWLGSPASDVLNFTQQIIEQARLAKPDIKFAYATLVHSAILDFDSVNNRINDFNAQLPGLLQSLNSTDSPIALVRLSENYACGPGYCPAAYDPVHPNSLGEFQIAQAFARSLRSTFSLGLKKDLLVPANPPLRSTPVPTNVTASGSPLGVTLTWNPVYGAMSYDVQYRLSGSSSWSLASVDSPRYDTTWTYAGQQWEYAVRTNNGNARNVTLVSQWSNLVSAVAAPQLASLPSNITITSSATGFDAAWNPPTGPYSESVDLYQVLWIDMDTPGAYLGGIGARGTSTSVTELVKGHRYATWMVSWNANGQGLPGSARPVTIGASTPKPPTNLQIVATDAVTIQMQWCGDPAAAGYRIWSRNAANNETLKVLDGLNSFRTNAGIAYLFPGTWNYEFCVSAFNGDAESEVGQCVRAGAPEDGPKGGPVGVDGCYDGSVPGQF